MVNLFKTTFSAKFDVTNTRILEEVGVGFGIADLVIAELKESQNFEIRKKLNSVDINVYQIVHRKRIVTLEHMTNITGVRQNEVKKSLDRLIEYCYVKKVDSLFELQNKYELPFKKSIAFEAKLRNWKRAFTQAYRYKWFADYSYVIMDEAHAKPAIENILQFKNYNVGLLTLSVDGNLKMYHRPKKQPPVDPAMQMMFAENLLHQ